MYLTAFLCFLRVDELLTLQMKDVVMDYGSLNEIKITLDTRKTDQLGRRTFLLCNDFRNNYLYTFKV